MFNFNESKSCLKNDFRVYTTRCFYDSIKASNSLYLTLGRNYYWPLEINPPSPSLTLADDVSFRQDIIFLKKVQLTDVSFVISRVDWLPNVVYNKYEPVLVKNIIADQIIHSVYMCVDTPKDQQVCLKQPMYNRVNPLEYIHNSDNYSWVLLYQLSDLEMIKFASVHWIPVPTDGRESSMQKKIMSDAYKRSYPYYNFYTNQSDIPINGYGSNPLYQLCANHLMFSLMIAPNESKINPETSFRQIGLMSNPVEKISSQVATKKSYEGDEIDLSSGQVLYFENRKAVLKKATQTENIQIILGF